MPATLPFFIVLLVAILFSAIVRKLHMPWVIALILGGILIGPYGAGLLEPNETLAFISELGLIFLMFMAGLHVRVSSIKQFGKNVGIIAAFNGIIPLLVGLGVSFLFGYTGAPALMLGIIFVSSSIALIIPALEGRGLLGSRLGNTIVGTVVVEDIASLIGLSILLQVLTPNTSIPLPLFYLLLVFILIGMRWIIPKIRLLAGSRTTIEKELFHQDVRVILGIMIGIVVLFELLGLHSIIAGFFAGFVLSESIRSERLLDHIHAIGYGIFVPVFFILVGTRTDLTALVDLRHTGLFVGTIVLASMLAKYFSGWIGARLAGFTTTEASFIGASTIPQLSTSLAAAIVGLELGILDSSLMAAIVALTIVTTFVAPILTRVIGRRIQI
ncbi:MAG: cation:proton antiporter [Candidatus Andersenbacteria bacterium]